MQVAPQLRGVVVVFVVVMPGFGVVVLPWKAKGHVDPRTRQDLGLAKACTDGLPADVTAAFNSKPWAFNCVGVQVVVADGSSAVLGLP